MATAVYPGTFDPAHNGHVDIVARASKIFDRLVVAVYESPPKEVLFTTAQRVEFFRDSTRNLSNVDVVSFDGLATDFAREVGAGFILRGLRAGIDFESEFEMTLMWRSLDPTIDVVCMMSSLQFQFVYSSRIKEVAKLGANVQDLVPQRVAAELNARFNAVS